MQQMPDQVSAALFALDALLALLDFAMSVT
jgi:hypothetical protein